MADERPASLAKDYGTTDDVSVLARLRPQDTGLNRPLKSWEPNELRPIHKQIIALSAAGAKNGEIAQLLNLSDSWVSVVLNHPEAQSLRNAMVAEFVTGLLGDTRDMITAHTLEAQMTVVSLMRNSTKDNIKLMAAKDVLDRGGLAPQQRIISTNINLSGNDAAALQAALREMNQSVPELQEAEVTSDVFTRKPDEAQ